MNQSIEDREQLVRLQAIALRVSKEMFTCDTSRQADKLMLMDADNNDLGGWGFNPIYDKILESLQEATDGTAGGDNE